jgi:hypothetical protein
MGLYHQFLIMMMRRHYRDTHSRNLLGPLKRLLLLRTTYLRETEGTGECLPDDGLLQVATVVVLPHLMRSGLIVGSVLGRIFESH